MVSEPTVLIVGAGGSIPYGFPSGPELVQEITTACIEPRRPNPLAESLLKIGCEDVLMYEFARQLMASRRYSVDAFLEKNSRFMEIGKLSIAGALLPLEKAPGFVENDWYRFLCDRLIRNIDAGKTERLTVATYNYDRSLDFYLYDAFKHSFNLNDEEMPGFLSNLEIIHLHGSLGPCSWLEISKGVPRSNGQLGHPQFVRAIRGIKIIHEQADDGEEYGRLRRVVGTAKRLVCLGFGYHPTNVKRLLHGGWLSHHHSVLGSALGLSIPERNDVEHMFDRRISLTNEDCYRMLKNQVGIIS